MLRNKSEFTITALLLVVFAAIAVNAGGPLMMWNAEQRVPYRWDVTAPVQIYTDSGPFEVLPANPPAGTVLVTNEKADEIVAFTASQWTGVETSSFQAQVVGDFESIGLPDVKDAATAALVFGPDNGGGLHVVYDADAKIMQTFFGAPPTVLGIASPEWADEATGTITEGWVIINAQRRWFNDNELQNYAGVFTHEFGHAINLAHSQTNGAIAFYGDRLGPASSATLPYPTALTINEIETMYPYINQSPTGSGKAQSTVDLAEDKAAISNLYPESDYASTKGSITGRVLQTNGKDGITGVNVIARNLDNPFADAVSAMSGDYVRVEAGDDGTFTLNGLTSGARYAVYTDMIAAGGFPTQQPLYMPQGEEFYSGANESGDGTIDDRCHMEPITAVAGSTATADIVLNSVRGAPEFSPMVPNAFARTVSANGLVIGGGITGGGTFRWSEKDGYEVLNQTPESDSGMSRDGSSFASDTLGKDGRRVASFLKLGSPWQKLPLPVAEAPAVAMRTGCSSVSSTARIAADGKTVAALGNVDTNGTLPGQTCRARPFLWRADSGSKFLEVPLTVKNSRVNSMSNDLSTIVGWHDTFGQRQAVRWVNGRYEELSTPGLPVGEAMYVTPDGSVFTGGNAGPQQNPWIWTRKGGLKQLGRTGPNFSAYALSASDDGKVVGGLGGSFSQFPGDASGNRAFLWTPELGTVDFENFLKAQGTFFEGWILWSTASISADGTTHIGTAAGPRGAAGWIIKLDKVNICHAPPGNPGNAHTINVPFRGSMADHLRHGDTVGVCTNSE